MSRTLFNRSEAVARPVKVVRKDGTDRPVYIQRGPDGVRFFDKATGYEITRERAVRLMRAYKHGDHAPKRMARERKAPKLTSTWRVELYRTPFGEPNKSKLIAQAEGQTFLAASTKLAALCMKHVSDKYSAVEVVIEQVR